MCACSCNAHSWCTCTSIQYLLKVSICTCDNAKSIYHITWAGCLLKRIPCRRMWQNENLDWVFFPSLPTCFVPPHHTVNVCVCVCVQVYLLFDLKPEITEKKNREKNTPQVVTSCIMFSLFLLQVEECFRMQQHFDFAAGSLSRIVKKSTN